eukprot:9239611-Pyramimonas_sp.AAC.1
MGELGRSRNQIENTRVANAQQRTYGKTLSCWTRHVRGPMPLARHPDRGLVVELPPPVGLAVGVPAIVLGYVDEWHSRS